MSTTDPGAGPSGATSGDSNSTTPQGKIKRAARRAGLAVALAAALAGVTGYTGRDLMDTAGRIGAEEFKANIEIPTPADSPASVKRCTTVKVTTTGKLPSGSELWLGTDLNGRKAIVEPLEQTDDHTYEGHITIGREQDKNQERKLLVLVVEPSSVSYLRNTRDKVSLYDRASSYWPAGTTVADQIKVRRDDTSTKEC